jgi:hypothetical protein
MRTSRLFSFFLLLGIGVLVCGLRADGPRDNDADNVRPIPPKGIAVNQKDHDALTKGLKDIDKGVAELKKSLKPPLRALLPDVEVLAKAVRYALTLDEFHNAGQIAVAHKLIEQAHQRAKDLRSGKAPWTEVTGLVVRGYRSKIDGSVQPYGLVVPSSWKPNRPFRHRLDLWCHGRGETLSELAFINERQKSPGQFTPADAFVLHPYGRYSNAFKFAGEIDVLEALADVKKHYPIDDNRVVMRGFSMGGAACWQFAVHYPNQWAAAAPGAGFSETPEFLRTFQGGSCGVCTTVRATRPTCSICRWSPTPGPTTGRSRPPT